MSCTAPCTNLIMRSITVALNRSSRMILLSISAGPDLLNAQHLGTMFAVAAAVTGARQALLALWPAFKQATDRSNRQVKTA